MMFGEHQIEFSALAGVINRPLDITIELVISSRELEVLRVNKIQMAQAIVRGRIGQENQTQLDLIQFMSSQRGREHLEAAEKEIEIYIKKITENPEISLAFKIQPMGSGLQITSKDTFAQVVVQCLEGACSPQSALFSYFPADRALPAGEVGIQIGSADLQQQIISHIAQPASKYSRLKQIIVNASVLGAHAREQLDSTFNAVFSELLPGKRIEAIQQKVTGAMTVLIRDERQDRVFDIDNMSSGEKGLILSFLLLRVGAAEGGIILLDEPELHLNPAVCARLIQFLSTHVVQPLGLQVLLCTHSAEVLTTALHREDCAIFHLRTPKDVTPVARRDHAELFEILRRLGLSSMEVVSWQGTIFLEGDDDIDLLTEAFPNLLAGYQLKSLGGRSEVEKDIRRLQDAENRGEVDRLSSFIFDRDRKPTSLQSSKFVRVLQWDRYCIENYLIDESILFDVMSRYCSVMPKSKGELRMELKDIALAQADYQAIRMVYSKVEPENCGFRPKEINSKTANEAAELLFDRLLRVQKSLANLQRDVWVGDFVNECKSLAESLRSEWDDSWRKECDAKRLFRDLQARYQAKVSVGVIKIEVMKEMRMRQSEDWKIIKSLIGEAINSPV
jgi:hypothetical protein